MGTFNELWLDETIDNRGAVQFKFGECRQYEYRLGDTIIPDKDVRSSSGIARVLGIGGGGPSSWRHYVITFTDGVITACEEISDKQADDMTWMERAIEVALGNLGKTAPNPVVGCVIVRDGVVLSQAATAPGGRPHAEEQALVGVDARGATAYVTLEPCGERSSGAASCSLRLAEAGVARVVIACEDPSPFASGQGIERLRAAGIAIESGTLCDEAWKALDYQGWKEGVNPGGA